MTVHNAITDVPGIEVGHYTDRMSATGCTVVMCRHGAVGGVDVRVALPARERRTCCVPGILWNEPTQCC